MAKKRKVDIFSAGCPVCQDTIDLVNEIACPSCEIRILDMQDDKVVERARALGITALPAVVIDGQLADCCSGRGVDKHSLSQAGVGQPLS